MNSLSDKFLRISLKLLTKLEAGSFKAKSTNIAASQNPKVIYVTSAVAKEGKSFVAHAIAKALIRCTNHKVLLIDGNMDSPSELSKGKKGGISTFFTDNKGDILQSVIKEESIGVDFLPSGNSCKPGLLYQHDKVDGLLSELSGHYDIIIVDGASLLKSGANSLAHIANGVVLVIKGESTSKDIIKEAMLEFDVNVEKYYGAILNNRPKYIPDCLYKKLS